MVDTPEGRRTEDGHSTETPATDARLARLDRLRDSRAWSFSGPVGDFAAAVIAGFDPVGRVFGTTVAYLGPPGLGNCFVPAVGSAGPGARSSANPHNRLLGKLKAARALALDRAVAECRALGGDGVVDMRFRTTGFFSDTVEFTVEGTAVRTRAPNRLDTPFTTHVSGPELARLLGSGYMPFALVFGMAIAACHFDDSMYRQTQRGIGAAGNREVSGYTRIVNDARREARDSLQDAVRRLGGEGAVAQETTLHFSERECPLFDQRTDYLAEATVIGSAIVSLERDASTEPQRPPLTIMRLDRRADEPAAEPEPESDVVPGFSLGDRVYAYWSGRDS